MNTVVIKMLGCGVKFISYHSLKLKARQDAELE